MSLSSMRKAEIKVLRADARRLVAIAGHLRDRANSLAAEAKAEGKAEQVRTNFYSKQSKITHETIHTPLFDEQTVKGGK